MAEIEIIVKAGGWNEIAGAKALAIRAAALVLARRGDVPASTGLSILLGDDATLKDLNARFRGFDKPTNVLSFPAQKMPGATGADRYLGDIALAFETCLREAGEEGKSVADHMSHLVVHGVLHLLGYDHETDREAKIMEAEETAVLAAFGIADPYRGAGGGASE